MSFAISGKTAIVTGAANGIGLAIGRHFLEKGANVMFADIDEKSLQKQLGGDIEGESARYWAGDLREKLTIANLLSATIDAFDRVDILVNGARQVIVSEPLSGDDDSVMQLLYQNLIPPLRLSQVIAQRMIKQADGRTEGQVGSIINLSSIAAQCTHSKLLAYSVSSAALDQMTRSLAVTLAPERIRVNAVAFGSVMSASLLESLKKNADYREDIEQRTPMNRIAAPSELVETVQYLASEGSSFVTGQILTVDGGRTLLDPVTAPAH
ncbi:MAG: SDR family oxidoreductase [Aestuariivita sp.]|nr:SDR family oxidoreductase [Aestuariivita sp.]MCY4346855.1 SDR family oxidoreductase [Aestuariivita sp.]